MSDSQRILNIEGRGLPLAGDDIDTDRIVPARYLRVVSFEGIDEHVFEDDRKAGAHPFDDPRFAGARILIVHRNFGCGSSREHAPQAIHRWGIRAIVGESFSDIFFGNSAMMGLPCFTAARGDLETLMALVDEDPARTLRVSVETLQCTTDGFGCGVRLPAHARDAFVSGAWDTTGMLLERFDEVRAVASRLRYIAGFTSSRPA